MDKHTDRYRQLFERSGDAILIIEGDTFLECNEASARLFGHSSREEILQSHPSEISPEVQPDGRSSFVKANEMIATAFEQGSHRFEWTHQRVDGECFPTEVLLTVVQGPERLQLHSVVRDITGRKNLEDQLRHAQKMEAIGKLAGGIAHDFNNLLVAVLGHSDLLERHLKDDPTGRAHVGEIRDAGQRAANLVRQLLSFGRKQPTKSKVIDLNTLVVDLRSLLERIIGEDVALITRGSESSVNVKGDRGQLEQVLMNLASNARDAMPEGGTLCLEVDHVQLGDTDPSYRGQLPDGPYSTLSVSDTGTGMDQQTANRALDPFFTTKEVGKGTGLGLSTAYGIIKALGGALRIYSVPGHGTTVKILLPRTLSRPSLRISRPPEEPSGGGSETILLVEDEQAVSTLVAETLRGAGYDVLLARDGREGMAIYQRNAEAIELVLTDVMMPNISGPDMIRAICDLGHSPRVLFLSGYSGDTLPRSGALPEGQDLLEKPFRNQRLLNRVREILDSKPLPPPMAA